jgi:hypothetical protein
MRCKSQLDSGVNLERELRDHMTHPKWKSKNAIVIIMKITFFVQMRLNGNFLVDGRVGALGLTEVSEKGCIAIDLMASGWSDVYFWDGDLQ